jgi:uncharacterized protein (TIGR03083 family)
MTDHLRHLRADVEAILAVLDTAALTEPVSACPGWTLRELVEHLGSVHRWATGIVRSGAPAPLDEERGIDDLRPWFTAGAQALVEALAAADPEAPCWTFTSARTMAFWPRRQALETVVHRWDAERAAGEPGPIDAGLAADGVDEVVTLMVPRQIKLQRIPALPATLQLHATDTGDDWVLGDGEPTARVEGSAEHLLLLLWHRLDPGDPRVRTSGDATAVLRLALAP